MANPTASLSHLLLLFTYYETYEWALFQATNKTVKQSFTASVKQINTINNIAFFIHELRTIWHTIKYNRISHGPSNNEITCLKSHRKCGRIYNRSHIWLQVQSISNVTQPVDLCQVPVIETQTNHVKKASMQIRHSLLFGFDSPCSVKGPVPCSCSLVLFHVITFQTAFSSFKTYCTNPFPPSITLPLYWLCTLMCFLVLYSTYYNMVGQPTFCVVESLAVYFLGLSSIFPSLHQLCT